MNTFFKLLGLILLLLLLVICIVPIFLPSKVSISVEKDFDYNNEIIFNEFSNLQKFTSWNAQLIEDSTMVPTIFAPYKGKGSSFKWESSMQSVGKGEQFLVDEKPGSYIKMMTLKDTNGEMGFSEIFFISTNTNTHIKWNYESKEVSYFERFKVYFSEKEMLEKTKESLQNLQDKLDALYQKAPKNKNEVHISFYSGALLMGVKNSAFINKKLPTVTFKTLKTLNNQILKKEISPTSMGSVYILRDSWDTKSEKTDYTLGYLRQKIDTAQLPEKDFLYEKIAPANAMTIEHTGSLLDLSKAYDKLDTYAQKHKFTPTFSIEKWSTSDFYADSVRIQIYQFYTEK